MFRSSDSSSHQSNPLITSQYELPLRVFCLGIRDGTIQGRLQPDPFLNDFASLFERSTEKGSVWVTLKRSSDKSKVQRNKMTTAGEAIEHKCLVRASDGKKTISTLVGTKDHQRFQASYATILKARMTALKNKERKDKRKAMEVDEKQRGSKKRASTKKA